MLTGIGSYEIVMESKMQVSAVIAKMLTLADIKASETSFWPSFEPEFQNFQSLMQVQSFALFYAGCIAKKKIRKDKERNFHTNW